MFIASKYEDIVPLFMKTLVTRIGHNRFTKDEILSQERDILSTLRFRMAAVPTTLEFLERYLTKHGFFDVYPYAGGQSMLLKVAKYLALISTHHI
mmetsp:Transcript_33608/g.44317  ORF Transcript_33608/g.44317 Transcript_33608/m.44317 type:complete len:95 (-) Transcript_33608:483-767(-)